MREGARESVPERGKTDLWGPKGAKMEPKWKQMGAENVPKIEVSKKVLKVVWTNYSREQSNFAHCALARPSAFQELVALCALRASPGPANILFFCALRGRIYSLG